MGRRKISGALPKFLVVLVVLLSGAAAAVDKESIEALIEAEHWKRARALIEPLFRANPGEPRANFLMACCYEAAGEYNRALALAEKAVAIEPKNADYHLLLAFICGRQAMRAGILRQIGLALRIRREAETALGLNPNHVEARIVLAEYFFRAPGIFGGDKNKARALAEEVVKLNPALGYLEQASLARRERKQDRMEDLYKKAVEANAQSYRALMALAGFYSYGSQSNFDLAEKYAREAIKLDPGRSGAYGLLAQNSARQERWQELDDILGQAEKNVPDNLNPYFQAGRTVLQDKKDPGRAERYFRKYLTQEPEPTSASPAQAYWRLGQALERQNRKAEAVEAITTALKLDPGLDSAKKDLKRLRSNVFLD